MLNKSLKLNENIFEKDFDKAGSRDGFADGLVEAGEQNKNVVALTADLNESARTHKFAEKFPERFIQVGIAEQNLASVASGMAAMGKIPFAASYAIFSPGRNWEQIRTTICYNDQPVKIIGSHAGLLTGPDGGTHQALEDIAITRVLPRMVVICPCDYDEARKATIEISKITDPTYLRLSREKTAKITTAETPFVIGKGITVFDSADQNPKVGIISTGVMLHSVLKVAQKIEKEGTSIEVLHLHTIKPIDKLSIISLAKRAGKIVTVEQHQVCGGLGSAVAEVLAENHPTIQEFVGVKDRYGQSGDGNELLHEYGLDEESIEKSIRKILER